MRVFQPYAFIALAVSVASGGSVVAQTWLEKLTLSSPVTARMVWDAARGRGVLFGGYGGEDLSSDTWEWNGQTWARVSTAGPTGRQDFDMVYDAGRRRTLLFGGQVDDHFPLRDTWEWDGAMWRLLAPLPAPAARWGLAMAYDAARGNTVLFGGQPSDTFAFGDTWVFDGVTWSERALAVRPTPRSGAAMSYDAARQRVVLFGGYEPLQICGVFCQVPPTPLADTWEWDGTAWTQLFPAASPPADGAATMAYDATRQRIVLYGHEGTWEWDGITWTNAAVATAGPDARADASLAYDLVQNRLLLFGGSSDAELYGFPNKSRDRTAPRTWSWDGVAWSVASEGTPAPRGNAGFVYDSARQVAVLFGGSVSAGRDDETWEWDGTRWDERNPAVRPPARTELALAYDSGRARTVMFGGYGTTLMSLPGTWEWDGTNWTLATPGTSPQARWGHAMAYDASRGRVVLFGGIVNNQFVDDTWEWDGVSWLEVVSPARPIARYDHRMVYDPVHGCVTLFGGSITTTGRASDDTWSWDGATWTQHVPAVAPAARSAHGMTWDAVRQSILVHGGDSFFGSALDDTWEWNGTDWQQLFTATLTRRNHAIVHDSARQQTMLFSGNEGSSTGAVWLLKTTPVAARTGSHGAGCGGALGVPVLRAYGVPSVGNTAFACDLVGAAVHAPAALLLGTTPAELPLAGCRLLVDPALLVALPAATNPAGFATTPFPVPPAFELVGIRLVAQYAVADASAGAGISMTQGLQLTIGD